MKRVTLTFDNGPTVETTPSVLATLDERGLPAWFCVVGAQLAAGQEQRDIAAEAMRAGHRLVNHSMTHEVPLGDRPTAAHARAEILEMDLLLDASFGSWGPKWFRPFGRGGQLGTHLFSQPAADILADRDYSVMLWNCVPRDWVDTGQWPETALRQIDAVDHAVLVLHDLNTGAMAALPEFLDNLLDKDVRFTLDLPESCVPFRRGSGFADGATEAFVNPGGASS